MPVCSQNNVQRQRTRWEASASSACRGLSSSLASLLNAFPSPRPRSTPSEPAHSLVLTYIQLSAREAGFNDTRRNLPRWRRSGGSRTLLRCQASPATVCSTRMSLVFCSLACTCCRDSFEVPRRAKRLRRASTRGHSRRGAGFSRVPYKAELVNAG